jgi:hypothetical protein
MVYFLVYKFNIVEVYCTTVRAQFAMTFVYY